MPVPVEAPSAAAPFRRRLSMRRVLLLALTLAALFLAIEAFRVLVGTNIHTIIPGQAYRCAQPSAQDLDELIAAYRIRSVVNLRGNCDGTDWYIDECRATHYHNVSQHDINFSAGRLPSTSELRQLLEVLDHTDYPILLHCRRGADRTGVAATMVLLLKTAAPLAEARQQLSCRYGHVAMGRTASLDQFVDYYACWLETAGRLHSPDTFRDWALHHYCPGACWSVLSWAEPPPTGVRVGQNIVLRVRVRNASLLSWRLSPALTAGVHLGCFLFNEQDQQIAGVKAGLRDGEVHRGETVEFTVVLSPVRQPGRYRLQVDMSDEQQCWFYQTGSEPLNGELVIRE